jgi:ribosome-associated heat shock protein Hsp15
MTEKLRIDKYLWAIRVFKTRTQAAVACDRGKVKLNGIPVKASRIVSVGDVYEIKTEARKWLIEVVQIIDHRVQYAEAVKCYTDITPEEDKQYNQRISSSFYTGKRLSKTGHPTKKQRRNWNNWMGGN